MIETLKMEQANMNINEPEIPIEPLSMVKMLNLPTKSSLATILVKLRGNIGTTDRGGDNYQIKITDCSNSILLHGNLKSPDSRRNAINKLDTLIDVLTQAKEHIEQELKKNKLEY